MQYRRISDTLLTLSSMVAGKFFGSCNDAKAALDACFRAEKDHKRKQNLEKARADQKQFKEYMSTIEARKNQGTSA